MKINRLTAAVLLLVIIMNLIPGMQLSAMAQRDEWPILRGNFELLQTGTSVTATWDISGNNPKVDEAFWVYFDENYGILKKKTVFLTGTSGTAASPFQIDRNGRMYFQIELSDDNLDFLIIAGGIEIVLLTGIELSPTAVQLMTNTKQQLTARLVPDNASYQSITWSSSDTSIAKVDKNGQVTGLSPGTVTISAAAQDGSGLTAASTITVFAPEGWLLDDLGWRYYHDNSRVSGWLRDNSKWYFLDVSGLMQTGWLKDSGLWYHLNESGAMDTGWINDSNNWYFLALNGVMQTGWVSDHDSWYFMNSNGAMKTGWLIDCGSWYYMNAGGAMKTGWLEQNGTWYYLMNDGAMATGRQSINGRYNSFSGSGAWLGYK